MIDVNVGWSQKKGYAPSKFEMGVVTRSTTIHSLGGWERMSLVQKAAYSNALDKQYERERELIDVSDGEQTVVASQEDVGPA